MKYPFYLSFFLLSVLVSATTAADEPLKPTNLSTNTKADEDDPHLSSNGLTLYYTSNATGKWVLMNSTRQSAKAAWKAGTPLEVNFALESETHSNVFITPDKVLPQFLFYSTKNGKLYTLFGAIRSIDGRPFSTPTAMGIEDTKGDELHPWMTADGKQLYFSRKTNEGWRVFVSKRADNSGVRGFQKPEMVDLPVGFHHATLSPDAKTMYLQGPLEKDRWGLFVSLNGKEGWSKPEPLELLNNAEGPTGDRSPNLSRDGTMLYFASDRPGGKGGLDIWVIPTAGLKGK